MKKPDQHKKTLNSNSKILHEDIYNAIKKHKDFEFFEDSKTDGQLKDVEIIVNESTISSFDVSKLRLRDNNHIEILIQIDGNEKDISELSYEENLGIYNELFKQLKP